MIPSVMSRLLERFSLIALIALATPAARAHDPYEITSVAYVHSNRLELLVSCEFVTGMRLAGIEPQRDVPVASQLAAAQPALLQLAGSFFAITAGNHAVPPLRTNVQLDVEDHLQLQLEFAPTPHRPLQFTARALSNVPDSPYGTTLTVLDMVNQKVLGQSTLFATADRAEFPPRPTPADPPPTPVTTNETPPAPDTPIVSAETTNLVSVPTSAPTRPPFRVTRQVFIVLLGSIGIGLIILIGLRRPN